ncbi:MAG: (Fe-S)-binding protein [Verrucomicrobia bacterium]|nr:(Fe-S)-binding protein [Verrucomicrobiota bacterium]
MEPSHSHDSLKALDYSFIQQCMHCGFCLPTCPTYDATHQERNSPRGRIALMRGIADGRSNATAVFAEEMYFCLGCLACMTACPAGVDYALLFETARAEAEMSGVLDTPARTWTRELLLKQLFTRPRLLRLVGRSLRLYQASGLQSLARKTGLVNLLPRNLRNLERQTPSARSHFSHQLIKKIESPIGVTRYRVGLLTGCVQDIVFSDINRDTVDVLLANGCEVFTPGTQYCCGSLHSHNGEPETARTLARHNLDVFGPELQHLDAIITNAAGCGSHLKTYARLLSDDSKYCVRAVEWTTKLKDISEWLIQIGIRQPLKGSKFTVTYHEACHLCHGQKISNQPRMILRGIPGLKLIELPEATWCCGSAGIYNITQPEMSQKLLERKIKHIASTGASTVAVANPGCHLQIDFGARSRGLKLRVRHPVSILAEAYRAENAKTAR